MSFWDKTKYALARFMQGRYGGADKLNRVLLYGSLILILVNAFLGWPVLSILYTAMYIYAFFRIFSRNVTARYQENVKFEQLFARTSVSARQFTVRVKNMRKFKYFTCPKCKSKLRLPRGVGEVTVTCGKCGEKIKQRA